MPNQILIVDDEPAIVEGLSGICAESGYEPKGFTHPQDALKWGKENSFDVLIVDLKMSSMTGLSLHYELQRVYPNLITILMTGYSSFESAKQAVSAGVYSYVNKPFDSDSMMRLIHQAIEKKELISQNEKLVDKQQSLIEELLVANKRLMKLDKIKSDFVSTVSHELRTPLTSLRNFLFNMSQGIGGPLSDKQREYVQMMESDSTRLETLISDILDFSSMQAGSVKLHLSTFRVGKILEGIMKLMNIQFDNAGIDLNVEVSDSVRDFEVVADGQKMEQVLINLLSNSIKYSNKGKKVWLKIKQIDDQLVVEVKDQGYGIGGDDLERVFYSFERAENNVEEGIRGTGLGLTIVRGIVELHGGSVSVKSVVGKGSTFRVTIPVKGPSDVKEKKNDG